MKKIFAIFAVAIAAMWINSCATSSKVNTDNDKESVKEAKAYFKEKSREGFSAVGTGDQETLFYKYISAKNAVNPSIEFDESATGAESAANSKVENRILAKYAAFIVPTNITSRVVSELGEINGETFDSFYSAYKTKVSSVVTASSLRTLKLRKEVSKDVYRYEIYAFEDPSAHTKRVNALLEAAEESGLAQEYAERVSDWIDNGGK